MTLLALEILMLLFIMAAFFLGCAAAVHPLTAPSGDEDRMRSIALGAVTTAGILVIMGLTISAIL